MHAAIHRAKVGLVGAIAGLAIASASLAAPDDAAACRLAADTSTSTARQAPDLPPPPPSDPFGYSGCVDEQFGHWWRDLGYWQEDVKAWADGKVPPQ